VWIVGVLLLLCVNGAITAFLNRGERNIPPRTLWDLSSLGKDYATILATLAGIAITAVVFLAELRDEIAPQAYASVLGIFSISLVIMVGGSLAYGTSSNALDSDGHDEDERIARCVLFILVTSCFYGGVALSMLGLHPLLIYIELEDIAEIMAWLLLFSLFAGGNRLGAWMFALLGTRNRVSALASPQAILAAGSYRLLLAPRFPELWPQKNPAVVFSVLVMMLAAIPFFLETTMLRYHGQPSSHRLLRRVGPTALPPFISAVLTAVALVWMSLVLDPR
jgi:hypothetical protein